MKRSVLKVLVLGLLILLLVVPITGQSDVPTRVPPTPLPQTPTLDEELLPMQSAVARIRDEEVVNVGILYNAPPFGELTMRGTVSGFDADMANSMAQAWGVQTNFIQVTRQPEVIESMLRSGTVDMVVAALIHRRELDDVMEFSQTYYLSQKSMMVAADSDIQSLSDMAGRRVGVVIETPAADAVEDWITRSGVSAQVASYLTLDRAYIALLEGDIDGLVDSQHRLTRVASEVTSQQTDLTRTLEEPVEQEPYAVGVLQQDIGMRNLVNRTLHYLTSTGRMREILQVHFPGEVYDEVTVWQNVGDEAPSLDQFADDLSYPQQYVLPRVQSGGVLRVAGFYGGDPAAMTESQRRLDVFHRGLIDEMAARWEVGIDYIPNSTGQAAIDMVANGEADIAVGVAPDWEAASRVDFSRHYLLHGERLMVRTDDDPLRFGDLTGDTLVIPVNEEAAADQAVDIAESVNTPIDLSRQREADLAFSLLADEELDAAAVFGDSLKLIPHVQSNPDDLTLTMQEDSSSGRWYAPATVEWRDYGPREMAMALPRNDIEFRLLVEYTIQELIKEEKLRELLGPVMMPEDIPEFIVWPGSSIYQGIDLSR